jgi:hypothetical protein
MPPRTSIASTPDTPQGRGAALRTIAGLVDDPIGFVRIRWGAYNAGSRILTMQVVDRLDRPYPPRSYLGYNRTKGTADGRWIINWYIANSSFGTPVSCAGAYTAGKQYHDLAGYMASETDESGTVRITITKSGDETWCQAGIGGLLRNRGIHWLTAPDDDAPGQNTSASGKPGSGGGSSGGGGSGSGDIIVVASS